MALPGILVAITFHEYMHGYVAWRFGDPTAARAGRLSPEPWRHIDLFGFLALLIVGFGWAKPVPIDPRYFRRPRLYTALVGLAGPLTNFALAMITALVLAVWQRLATATPVGFQADLYNVITLMLVLNIAFGLFNLIPVPPLDGSRILSALLPPRLAEWYDFAGARAGLLLVAALFFVLVSTGIVGPVVQNVSNAFYSAALALVGL